MPDILIRDMLPEDEYFVSTCSHINEASEWDASGQRRAVWLRKVRPLGMRVKVGLCDGVTAGFAYLVPIEQAPWQITGKDCLFIPCAWVLPQMSKKGVGAGLLESCEEEARRSGVKALVAGMPPEFLLKRSYTVARHEGRSTIYWKVFDRAVCAPEFLHARTPYTYIPIAGHVAIDLFWNSFCQTSDVEAARVRKVAGEFGADVVLREYCADDRQVLLRYALPRGIYVNGKLIGWGGEEAPEKGLREAFAKALAEVRAGPA